VYEVPLETLAAMQAQQQKKSRKKSGGKRSKAKTEL